MALDFKDFSFYRVRCGPDRMVIVFTFTYAIKCRHLKWSVLFHSMESFARYNFIIKFFSGLQPVGDFHGEGVFRFPRPISQKYCY